MKRISNTKILDLDIELFDNNEINKFQIFFGINNSIFTSINNKVIFPLTEVGDEFISLALSFSKSFYRVFIDGMNVES